MLGTEPRCAVDYCNGYTGQIEYFLLYHNGLPLRLPLCRGHRAEWVRKERCHS